MQREGRQRLPEQRVVPRLVPQLVVGEVQVVVHQQRTEVGLHEQDVAVADEIHRHLRAIGFVRLCVSHVFAMQG